MSNFPLVTFDLIVSTCQNVFNVNKSETKYTFAAIFCTTAFGNHNTLGSDKFGDIFFITVSKR